MTAPARRQAARPAPPGLVALLAALLLAGCASLGMYPRQIALGVEEMQARLEQRFPVRRSARPVFELELARPALSIDAANGRIALALDVRLAALVATQAVEGRIALSGVPRLDPRARSVLMSDLRVDALEVDRLAPETAQTLRLVVEALVRQLVQEQALYTIDPERLRFGALALRPTGIALEPGQVVVRVAPAGS